MSSEHLTLDTMTFNPSRYEYPYGIHMLDDIHNLFPEFLYDSGMFPGNQLLAFLQMRANELFPEEFAHNRSQYRLFQLNRRRREAGIPTTPQRRSIPMPPTLRRRRQGQEQGQEQEQGQTFTIPLTNLFHSTDATNTAFNTLLASALLGTRQDLTDLLTPVVVAPTREQIAEASIVSSLEPPADAVCAVCQDHVSPTSSTEWRILRHCSHRFHRPCIDEWFRQNAHCPVCRHDIRESDTA